MRLEKITQLTDGRLLLAWWANNRGRGSDNCTLAIVPAATTRAYQSAKQTDIVALTRTSSWAGDVNLSSRVCNALGIARTMIVR